MSLHILIAEQHEIVVDGIKDILATDKSMGAQVAQVQVSCDKGFEEGLSLPPQQPVDLLVMESHDDWGLPIQSAIGFKKQVPTLKILVYTGCTSPQRLKWLSNQEVDGILLKEEPAQLLLTAIQELRHDGRYRSPKTKQYASRAEIKLTNRENQVLQLILLGNSMKEMATALRISTETIKSHRKNLMRKLGSKSINELCGRARDLCLID
jgi:DNA-binding NarL/FixJ family response regulator